MAVSVGTLYLTIRKNCETGVINQSSWVWFLSDSKMYIPKSDFMNCVRKLVHALKGSESHRYCPETIPMRFRSKSYYGEIFLILVLQYVQNKEMLYGCESSFFLVGWLVGWLVFFFPRLCAFPCFKTPGLALSFYRTCSYFFTLGSFFLF